MHADYLDFLAQVTPDNQEEYLTHMRRFNLGPVGEADCPVFDGMFEYFRVRGMHPTTYLAENTACCIQHACAGSAPGRRRHQGMC